MTSRMDVGVRTFTKEGQNGRSYLHFEMQVSGYNEAELRWFFEEAIRRAKNDGVMPEVQGDLEDWLPAGRKES